MSYSLLHRKGKTMARTVNGVSSLIQATRWICRIVGRFGVHAMSTATTPEFAAALTALVAACHAWEALDPDYPGQIDHSGGGSEDSA